MYHPLDKHLNSFKIDYIFNVLIIYGEGNNSGPKAIFFIKRSFDVYFRLGKGYIEGLRRGEFFLN